MAISIKVLGIPCDVTWDLGIENEIADLQFWKHKGKGRLIFLEEKLQKAGDVAIQKVYDELYLAIEKENQNAY